MKKLLLGGRNCDKEQILQTLRETGVVHVEAANPEKVAVPASLNEETIKCEKALRELSQINCINEEDKIETPGTPNRLVAETLKNVASLTKVKEQINDLNKELDETLAWGNIGIKDLNYLKGEGLQIVFAKGNSNLLETIQADFCQIVFTKFGVSTFVIISRNEIILPEGLEVVEAPARDESQIHEEIMQYEKMVSNLNHALQCLKLRISDIEDYHKKLLNQKRFAEVSSGVENEASLFILTGWCPEKQIETLRNAFENADLHVGMDFQDPDEEEIPPTLLDNKAYSNSIEPLYEFMGMTPSYNEPDTSFLFLSTLVIFSGFLIADAGYGLLVALPLIIFYKQLINKGIDRKFLKLAIFIFGGGAIYGLLTNSWFGYSFKTGFLNTGFDSNSEAGTRLLQQLCFFFGTVHLTIAHIWKITRHKISASVIGDIGWIIFLWAMYGLICPMITGADFVLPGSANSLFGHDLGEYNLMQWLFIVSLTMIMLFTAPQANIFRMLGAGVASVLGNASNAFSDILSYIRLWAVGLAGSKVAGAFNDIAAMLCANGSIVSYLGSAVLLIFGHVLNIILAIIAILAHGARLNLLEFSNHLELEWAGKKYAPFKIIS